MGGKGDMNRISRHVHIYTNFTHLNASIIKGDNHYFYM